ncbi:MAG: hypothetical protein HY421_00285 [Candidatus Kerfeldbacteria bacterium]|nr:hypothetical protein [Candidatus Kerfeldbacteria bacterium]
MPDINLLSDTRQDEPRRSKPKAVPPAPVEYSSPDARSETSNQLRKPSGIGLWIRSLWRGRTPKKPANRPLPRAAAQPGAKRAPDAPASAGPEPEDIFADIPAMTGGPAKRRPPPPASFSPTGPPPGEFPPLPKLPAWNEPPPVRPALKSATGIPPVAPPPPPRRTLNIPPPPRRPGRAAAAPAESGSVNLLPAELVSTFNPQQKLTTLGLTALATALLVGIIDVPLLLWKETQVRRTNEKRVEVAEVIAKIKSLEKEQRQAITLKASNDVVRQLLNRHVYWTKLLELFERYTLPSVNYPSGITADVTGTLNLVGSAPDIETILQQLAVYQRASELVKTVTIDTVNREKDGTNRYSFVADFTLAPTAFYRPIDATVAGVTGPTVNP